MSVIFGNHADLPKNDADPAQWNYQRYLSPFQIEKFTYMFETFFDCENHDGFIQKGDVVELLEKIRIYCDLKEDDARYLRMVDILYAFYDCLMEQVKIEVAQTQFAQGFDSWSEALKPHNIKSDNISLNQWLNMWGKLCYGAAGISGFPIWVQLLGHLFFDTIDRDGDGVCSIEELKNFYKGVIGVDAGNLTKVTTEGYRALTAVSFIFGPRRFLNS